jgi:hypothetical protein
MRKLVLSFAGAFTLLFAISLAWNSQVVAYSGILAGMPTNSPVELIDCDVKDELCEMGFTVICQSKDGKPDCQCAQCGGHAACPTNASIPCGKGLCCKTASGSFACCPR